MKKGYIYIIKNHINNKVYIGQTSKTPIARFKEHIKDSRRENVGKDYHIYRAIRKYGSDKFYVEELECCDIDDLDERETFYIKKFNSFYNGYNSTLGGGGRRLLDLDEDMIVNMYAECESVTYIAKELGHSPATITLILNKNDVRIKSMEEKGLSIHRCDENGNILQSYVSINAAARWVIDNLLKDKDKKISAVSQNIRNHIVTGIVYKGFCWTTDDLDKEELERRKNHLIEQWTSPNRVRTYHIKKDTCPYCGSEKYAKSTMCSKCQTKMESKKAAEKRNKKCTRENLKNLIRTKKFVDIAHSFSVSDTTIRKWCKAYNLPFKSSDIATFSDEEWALV